LAELDDNPLVHAAVAGNYQAFEQLVSRHERRLYALAWHMTHDHHDAQDVVQNAMMSVVEHLGDFRGDSSFGTWVTRITVNQALKLLRGRKQRAVVPLEASDGEDGEFPVPEYVADWRDEPQRILAKRELREVLDQGIKQLSEGQRLVFVLRDVEDFSVAETAEALSISPANVKVRLLRARLSLREHLTRKFGDDTKRQQPPENHDHSDLIKKILAAAENKGPAAGGSKP
jgi:RNA polymerase sigma-70 factor (ECF subfamily)